MSAFGSNGAARNYALPPDVIVLAILVAALIAGVPWIWDNFPTYLPGYLTQIAALLIGYGYAKVWRLPQRYAGWPQRALLLLSFAVPLQNTFIPKVLRKTLFDAHLLFELLRPEILLIIAVTVATAASRRREGIAAIPPLLKLAFALGTVGWLIATLFSAYPLQSLASGLFDFMALYVVLYVFVANGPNREFIVHCLILFIVGCVLVAASQMLAMWRELCCGNLLLIPATADEFIEMKRNTVLMMRVGANGYGNTDNFASLWVLLVPLLGGLYYVAKSQFAKGVLLVLLIYAGLLVYSRGGIIVIAAGLMAILAFRFAAHRKISVFSITALAALGLIHISGGMEYHARGMKGFISELAEHPPQQVPHVARPAGSSEPRPAGSSEPRPAGSSEPRPAAPMQTARPALESRIDLEPAKTIPQDRSGVERMQAWRKAAEVAAKNLLIGIGYGIYPIVDREYTAPHTLFLLRLAEGGLLSAISLLLLTLYVPWRLLQMARSRSGDMLEFSCLIAVGCFLVKGLIFGANFSIGGLIVWAYGVGLCLATSVLAQRWTANHKAG